MILWYTRPALKQNKHPTSFLLLFIFTQEEMTNALATMRVDFDDQIRLKEVTLSSNPLLNKRRNKKK